MRGRRRRGRSRRRWRALPTAAASHDAGFEIGCAKVVAGEAVGTCAAIVHQVHAAIGFTDEHPLHLFTRRLWSWRDAAGAERVWARRIGEAALARGGDALWPDLTARNEGRSGNA